MKRSASTNSLDRNPSGSTGSSTLRKSSKTEFFPDFSQNVLTGRFSPTFNKGTSTSTLRPSIKANVTPASMSVPILRQGNRKKSFEGERKLSFEGDRKKSFEGNRKLSFEGDRKKSFEGNRKKSFEGSGGGGGSGGLSDIESNYRKASIINRQQSFLRKSKSRKDILVERTIDLMEKQRVLNEKLYNENNGWNYNLELIAAKIGERASGLRWMHMKAISYYNIRYQVLGLILILIQAAAATGSITQIYTCSSTVNPVTIVVAVFMYITSVVSAFAQFKNWGARTQSHKQAMIDFAGVEQNSRIELGKYRRDRKNGPDYIEWVSGRFDEVNVTSPEIPNSIQKNYKVYIKDRSVADANDTIEPVEIKHDSSSPSDDILNKLSKQENNFEEDQSNDVDPENDDNSVISVYNNEPEQEFIVATASKNNSVIHLDPEMLIDDSIVKRPLKTLSGKLQNGGNVIETTGTTTNNSGDIIIDFLPELSKEKAQYEIKRFLQN